MFDCVAALSMSFLNAFWGILPRLLFGLVRCDALFFYIKPVFFALHIIRCSCKMPIFATKFWNKKI